MTRKQLPKKPITLNGDDNDFFGKAVGETVYGFGGDDSLFGEGGNDRLFGGSGDDLLNGAEGDDTLEGGNGDDVLEGGDGADLMRGGSGNDVLVGGAGKDTLRGNGGADTFAYLEAGDSLAVDGAVSASDSDVIADFRVGLDAIDLEVLGGANGFFFSGDSASARGIWVVADGKDQIVLADVSGDGVADFAVRVKADKALSASDFFGIKPAPALGSVTLGKIATDDIVTAAEAKTTINITGNVSGGIKQGDVVTIDLNGTIYVGAVLADMTYVIPVPGSALASDPDRSMSVTVTSKDVPSLKLASGTATWSLDLSGPGVSLIAFRNGDGLPGDGTFRAGETIQVSVVFTGPIKYTGTPILQLDNGKTATFVKLSDDSTQMIFTYKVGNNDDTDKLSVLSLGNGLTVTGRDDDAIGSTQITQATTQLGNPEIDTDSPGMVTGNLYASSVGAPIDIGGGFTTATPYGLGGNAEPGAKVFVVIEGPQGDNVWGPGGTNYGKEIPAAMISGGGWVFDFSKKDGTGKEIPDLSGTGNYLIRIIHEDTAGNRWGSTTPLSYTRVAADAANVINGTDFADNLKSDIAGVIINGLGGRDVLQGGDGDNNQTLNGGDGNDVIKASKGYDVINGGTDDDFVDYQDLADIEKIVVDLSNGSSWKQFIDGVIRIDTLSGIEHIIATDGDDQITGSDESNILIGLDGNDQLKGGSGSDSLFGDDGDDELQGGEGSDIIYAGDGDDTIDGGDGIDWADFSDAEDDLDIDLADTNQQDTGQGLDTIIKVENIAGGAGNDAIMGDDNDNELYGNDGDDTLNGSGGDDIIVGGDGDDDLDGGDGEDWASYYFASDGVEIDLSINGEQDTVGAGSDTLSNFENLKGSNFDDVLTGDKESNIILGNSGNDEIDGGDGNDTLSGGFGADNLTGGSGEDVFIFNQGDTGQTLEATDIITDFLSSVDSINVGFPVNETALFQIDNNYLTNFQFTLGQTPVTQFERFVSAAAQTWAGGVGQPTGAKIFMVVNYDGTGNALMAVNMDNDDAFGDGDLLIVLEGIAETGTIKSEDFVQNLI